MITRRVRRRRRLLDAYMRVEHENQGLVFDDRAERLQGGPFRPFRPQLVAVENHPHDPEDAREDQPA